MSVKSRIEKLEKAKGSTEPVITPRRIIYEGRYGGIDSEYSYASLDWGPKMYARAKSEEGETYDEFMARLNYYRTLTWQEAQTAEGIIFY